MAELAAVMKKLEEVQATVIQSKEELMNEITTKVTALETKMATKIGELSDECEELRRRLDEMEQYSRKKNVIVCGIGDKKEETEESLVEEMIKIAEKLQVNLDET